MSTSSPSTSSLGSAGSSIVKHSDPSPPLAGTLSSPAAATSVPSNHCAVSPRDTANNDGGCVYFSSEMANKAASDIEIKKFDNLLSWYYANYNDEKNSISPAPKPSPNPSSTENEKTSVKRKATEDHSFDEVCPKRPTLVDLSASSPQKKLEDDNPLRRMERMTNSSVFDASGINDVVESSAVGSQKNRESCERNAKLEKLGEMERQFGVPEASVELERLAHAHKLRKMMEAQGQCRPPIGHPGMCVGPPGMSMGHPGMAGLSGPPGSGLPSPLYPSPAGYPPSGALSAGVYPSSYPPQFGFPPAGPASAGAYPNPNGVPSAKALAAKVNASSLPHPSLPYGYPPHMRQHMLQQQQMHAQMMAARGMGMPSPGSYPGHGFHPGMGHPMHPMHGPGMSPGQHPMSHPYGHPGMNPRDPRAGGPGFPPELAPPPPYGFPHPGFPGPGMPPGYPPHPGMHPHMNMPKPGDPQPSPRVPDPSSSCPQTLLKEESSTNDSCVAAS